MKNQNEQIDEMIKKALSKEEASYYENLNEQSLIEMVGGLFKGKLAWFSIVNVLVTLVFTGLATYCLIQFLKVEETNELIRWGAGVFGSVMITTMMKIWNWNQMDKNAMMREIKRLELLIASKS